MTANPEKLTCISVVVCDEVYRDERTKKLIAVGLFNNIVAGSVPCKHQRITVLFSLTNGRGDYNLRLAIEHEGTGSKVAEITGPFKAKDPLTIADMHVVLDGTVFPEKGKYWVTVSADGEILQQRPFWVMVPSQPAPDRQGEVSHD